MVRIANIYHATICDIHICCSKASQRPSIRHHAPFAKGAITAGGVEALNWMINIANTIWKQGIAWYSGITQLN